MLCAHTQLDAHFHHPNRTEFWLNNQSYFEGWFSFMHKTWVGFYKQKHSFKSSWGPLQRWRNSKMTCASKTWVSCACAGSSGGSTAGCHASCAWLGWEAVKEHPPKGSADHLLPPSSFLLSFPLLSAARRNCSGGTWIMRSSSLREWGVASWELVGPGNYSEHQYKWIDKSLNTCCLFPPAPSQTGTAEPTLF